MTLRIDDEVKERLEKLADATQRSKSFLAAEAIRAYVETTEWQIGEIRKAVKEANAGDFASEADVRAMAKKWKVNARQVAAYGAAQPRRRRRVHRGR